MTMEKRSRQHMIIIALIGVIFGMTIGYSALSSVLKINGTSKVSGTWDIHFSKIEEENKVYVVSSTSEISGKTTATFNVDLQKPGSSIEYLVTVTNGGTMNATLESIQGIDEINAASPIDIVYSIEDIAEGDTLDAGDSKTFKVKVLWKATSTTILNTSKQATITLDFAQSK